MKLKIICCLFLFIFCFHLAGCATLGMMGSGFTQIIYTVVMLPLKIVSKIVSIANKLPRPPPWVFF